MMKPRPAIQGALLLLLALASPAFAQRTITGGGSSSVGVVRPPAEPGKTIVKTITYTAISPLRAWKNTEGKVITGHLLTHDPPTTADKDKEAKLPPTILRENKVRLLVGKKVFEIPLTSLSEEDQTYIQSLITAADKARAAP